jgi:hypothetical protein
MSASDSAKKFGLMVQLSIFAVLLFLLAAVGIGYLNGDVSGPAPAPVEEVIDYDQLYRNCMDSIEGYRDDGGSRWDDAADACAMIGSSEG